MYVERLDQYARPGRGAFGVRSMGDEPPDLFSEACGLAGPLRLRIEGAGPGGASTREFRRPFLVVGRDEFADVRIDRPEVSRRHAYFQVVAGRVCCVDLCSRTGVHWDDGARPVGWVDRGRGVGIGPVRVHVEGEEAGPVGRGGGNLPISRSFEWHSLPDARLEFLGAKSERGSWQVSRAMVLLGRSPICRVRLLGKGVGGIHAALVRAPGGIWAVGLHGPEGMRVRGGPTRCARLEDGDEIGLGDHRFRVRVGPAAVRTPTRSDLARRPSGRGGLPSPTTAGHSTGLAAGGAESRGRPELPGPVDSIAATLLDEFDRMHRRTAEQFQQAILLMFRMHQDQMDLFRDELARIDRLEDEQRSLKAEMARGNLERPPRLSLRLVSGGPDASPPSPDGPAPARSSSEGGGEPPIAPAPEARARGKDGPPPPGRQAAGSRPSPSDPDPHARLSRRLAEIQDEREGLWKKLLGSFTGGESGRILP